MKKLYLLIILFFVFAVSSSAQDISLPRDVAEKALKALELVPALEDKISKLETEVKELERAKQTPCTLAADKVKTDLTYWINQLDTSDAVKKREVQKILKNVRKDSQKILMSQCGFTRKATCGLG